MRFFVARGADGIIDAHTPACRSHPSGDTMKFARLPIGLLALALIGCNGSAADSHDRRLDALMPTTSEELEAAKAQLWELPEEQRKLLIEYFVRKNLGDDFFGEGVPQGITFAQALEEQRAYVAEQNTDEARLARRQAEAVQQMREAMRATLPQTAISRAEDGSEHLQITARFINEGVLGIKAFKGRLTLTDQFDEVVSILDIRNDDAIDAGQVLQWQGSRPLQQDAHNDDRRLAALKPGQYRVRWEPSEMLFADLTRIRIPGE